MNIVKTTALAALIASLIPMDLFASGGGGFSQGTTYQTAVDKKYEAGKLYFYSARVNGKKVRYCVKSGESVQRLSRSSLRAFENSTTRDLSDNLYNCEQPEQLIAGLIDSDQVSAVVYYLNKRYRLSLSGNS